MFDAKMILHSISAQSIELVCMALRYPKFIHGELMTHRRFSRNASSSRAIKTELLISEVRDDATRATFVHWGAEQKGMGADNELDDTALLTMEQAMKIADGDDVWAGIFATMTARKAAQEVWKESAIQAANHAEILTLLGAAKQVVNRVLEPYSHINVLISATDMLNFFGLRLDKAAQPEMRHLAELMWVAYCGSTPQKLEPGEWHLPYIDMDDGPDNDEIDNAIHAGMSLTAHELMIRMSVARCARVSYKHFETGKRSTLAQDLATYGKLNLMGGGGAMHASPAEHQATPDHRHAPNDLQDAWANPEQHGNFLGWRQYRKMLKGEDMAPLPAGYAAPNNR